MSLKWIAFEILISFLEMTTSCYFAAKLFHKELKERRDISILLLFAACGTALLSLRDIGGFYIPDFIPATVIFGLYALVVCKTKLWSAVLWALLNYLLIGVVALSVDPVLSIVLRMPWDRIRNNTELQIVGFIITRLGQLLLSGLILWIMGRFRNPETTVKREGSMIGVSVASIVLLTAILNLEYSMPEEMVRNIVIFICILVLALNFALLLFREILSREKYNNEELKEQNRLISQQIRNQNEVTEMYQSMRALRHDMNNHLHAISGYIQLKEYERAEEYIQKIAEEVEGIEPYRTGNGALDALISSKNALAKKNGIRVEIDLQIPPVLKIADEHLVIVVGNLYDNAIDANLKIPEQEKRFIRIWIQYRNEDLIISFENAAAGENRGSRGRWLTTKKDGNRHGYGIRNMDRIVQLYGGYSQRELKDNVFICRIKLPDIEVEKDTAGSLRSISDISR